MPSTLTPPVFDLPVIQPAAEAAQQISPDFVRLSAASAMALRLQSGRFARDFDFGGINLLLNYDNGCLSDCAYCGLARTRPGDYEDKSFIRVDWPLFDTDTVVDRMARYAGKLTRLCISMVTHGSAYQDTVEITRRIAARVKTPLSILVAPPTLNRERLQVFKDLGVDMIGVGLDAVTEQVFFDRRTNVPNGGLKWENYWDVINHSRDIFGPWKVNIHCVVGLGETDRDLVDMFYHLKERQILAYLFCFNPEPDSRMADHPKSPIHRWRRIQLIKYLIETEDLPAGALHFDADGSLAGLGVAAQRLDALLRSPEGGIPFMTDGCPGENGEPGCTRPYGSYRPAEEYRDFPFLPETDDMAAIRRELNLEQFLFS